MSNPVQKYIGSFLFSWHKKNKVCANPSDSSELHWPSAFLYYTASAEQCSKISPDSISDVLVDTFT